jgi:hypothetical protein
MTPIGGAVSRAGTPEPGGVCDHAVAAPATPRAGLAISSESWERAKRHLKSRTAVGYDARSFRTMKWATLNALADMTDRYLRHGLYEPGRARLIDIPAGMKMRHPAVPKAPDALWSRAWLEEFGPGIWDRLSRSIVGGRPGVSLLGIIRDVTGHVLAGPGYAFRYDVRSAFASMDRAVGLAALAKFVDDESAMKPVRDWYHCQGSHVPGIAEGFALAPVIFACFMAEHVVPHVEPHALASFYYLDDGLVFCRDLSTVRRVAREIRTRLRRVGLELHPKPKTAIYKLAVGQPVHPWLSFLGFTWEAGKPVPSDGAGRSFVDAAIKVLRKHGRRALPGYMSAWMDALGVDGPSARLDEIDAELAAVLVQLGVSPKGLPTLAELAAARAASTGAATGSRAPGSRKRAKGRGKRKGTVRVRVDSLTVILTFMVHPSPTSPLSTPRPPAISAGTRVAASLLPQVTPTTKPT